MLRILWLCMAIACTSLVSAQNPVLFPDSRPTVTVNGNQLKSAWAGGLNSPIVNEIDLNGDGKMDLVFFDRLADRLSTYINDGTPNQSSYHYDGKYLSLFPPMTKWIRTVDFDCDGDMDIFFYNNKAIGVYRNDYNQTNGLSFSPVSNHLMSWLGTFYADINGSDTNIPAITDLDNDGDIDILVFSSSNNTLEYHRNYFADSSGTGNCNGFNFFYQPYCWGDFELDALANIAQLNTVCRGNVSPDSESRNRHSGSILIGFDQGCDGDIDLLNGDILGSNLLFLENGGTSSLAHISSQDSLFPSYDVPVNLFNLPSAAYLDVNNDGKKDLIVTPTANSGEDFSNVLFYENTTDNCSNHFSYIYNRLIVEDMIDVGTSSNVAFADIDQDGLTDIIVGNDRYYNTNPNNAISRLAYFRNTGTASNPAFTLISDDWLGLSFLLQNGLFPSFADMDADGDIDILIGSSSGNLFYCENSAGAGNPSSYTINTTPYQGIVAGNNAAPQLIDVDRDGKIDLLIGTRSGKLRYYHNTSASVSSPVFTLESTFWGGVNVTKAGAGAGLSSPLLYDNNGSYELLVGSESGYIYHYNNIDGNLTGTFNLVDSVYQKIYEPKIVTISRADIDADGKMDLLTGNITGGLRLYTQSVISSLQSHENLTDQIVVSPNPSNSIIQIKIKQMQPSVKSTRQIEMFDILGSKLIEIPFDGNETAIDLTGFADGVYFLRVNIDGISIVKKVIKQ